MGISYMVSGIQPLVLVALLVAASYIDLCERRIPNTIVLFCLANRIVFLAIGAHGLDAGLPSTIARALLVGFALALPLVLIALISTRLRGSSGLGGGDIKLFSVLGTYFPLMQGLMLVAIACIFGMITRPIVLRLSALLSGRRTAGRLPEPPGTSAVSAVAGEGFPFCPAITLATMFMLLVF